jgi:hypothetical protein
LLIGNIVDESLRKDFSDLEDERDGTLRQVGVGQADPASELAERNCEIACPGSAMEYYVAGRYTGGILKGEKPADLAVQQATNHGE